MPRSEMGVSHRLILIERLACIYFLDSIVIYMQVRDLMEGTLIDYGRYFPKDLQPKNNTS
jgi:hypothetical protein